MAPNSRLQLTVAARITGSSARPEPMGASPRFG